MAGSTAHYGLAKLGAGESLNFNAYQFTQADRDRIDQLLYLAGEGQHHSGVLAAAVDPAVGPSLTLDTTQGTIPGGSRLYYKYSLVDVNGAESAASPETFIDTPAPIASPAAPSAVVTTTGGTLLSGVWYYALSAYEGVNTSETLAGPPAFITIPVGTSTNKVTLTLPTKPTGATGFNLYRRGPGESTYLYLTSIALDVATPPTTYVDNGSVAKDCNRLLPQSNTTRQVNAVRVGFPGATPVVPAGYTWRIYRRYSTGAFGASSRLVWVVDQNPPGTVVASFVDLGGATTAGGPLSVSQFVNLPSKVQLTDGAEVQGRLPMSRMSAFPTSVEFFFGGLLTEVVVGTGVWVCEFPRAVIVAVRASLGRGYAPASNPVIVDVNRGNGATPVMSTIFTTQSTRPKVLVGQQIGVRAIPQVTQLVEGDVLSADIDQIGGGATPNDRDLTISILVLPFGWTDPLSLVWA